MIVVDASAALSALFHDGPARKALGAEQLHAPHVIDSEVASGLRRHAALGQLSEVQGFALLSTWRRFGLTRYAVHPLLERVWQLRHNLSAYDAGYVALAEALGCGVLTADARLTRAAGLQCSVTLVPR